MTWINQLKKSLAGGYTTVMCPRRPLYFDFIQYQGHKWGRVWAGFCPLEDVYAFPDKGLGAWNIPADQLSHIQGIQANVWTERMHTIKRLDFMTFPRLCALAEAAWTQPALKDYVSFTKRMENAYREFDKLGNLLFVPGNLMHIREPAALSSRKEMYLWISGTKRHGFN